MNRAAEILHAPEVRETFPKPLPLPGVLPPVREFEPSLLPESFRPWVEDVAERIQCPVDFPAVGAMVALAAVVGRQIGIRPKRRDDWLVIPNLWGAVIGRPGIMKSPALSAILAPIRHLELSAKAVFEEEMRRYDAQSLLRKATAKQTEEDIRKSIREGNRELAESLATALQKDAMPTPGRRRYLTSDPTVEKLVELLAGNPRGILVSRDELVGFLKSLDREHHEGARAFYIEAWNGDGPFTVDRIGRGTLDVEGVCVSILGGIQPGPLSEHLRGVLRGGGHDDGFLQRFQLAVWPDVSGPWRNVDRWPDTTARQEAWDVFARLDTVQTTDLGQRAAGGGIPWLQFDAPAQEIFDAWRHPLEDRLRAGTESPAFESHISKYRSLVPTLALLIHLADGKEGPVTEEAASAAVRWATFLEGHARRVYSPALDPALTAARELDRHLLAGDVEDPFTARDVYRHCWRLLDRSGTVEAIEYLADFGRILPEVLDSGPAGGRPTLAYRLNPLLKRPTTSADAPSVEGADEEMGQATR